MDGRFLHPLISPRRGASKAILDLSYKSKTSRIEDRTVDKAGSLYSGAISLRRTTALKFGTKHRS